MDGLVQAAIDALRGLPPLAVYGAVFGFGFASSAFALDVVLPGEIGLIIGGWLASIGEPLFVGVYAAGAAGAVAGDSFSYLVGRRVGEPLIGRWEPLRRRLEPKIAEAREFYDRHGGAAVFWGRWVGALRSVVAFVAGVSRMRFGRFLAWNVLASLAWAAAVVSIGYFLGRYIVSAFRQATLAITVSVVALIALWTATRWISEHPERTPDWLRRVAPRPWVAVTVGAAVAAAIIVVIVLRGGTGGGRGPSVSAPRQPVLAAATDAPSRDAWRPGPCRDRTDVGGDRLCVELNALRWNRGMSDPAFIRSRAAFPVTEPSP